jgi:outer membrane protein TolC
MQKLFWIVIVIVCCLAVHAQDTQQYRVEPLSLKDCLLRAIKENLDVAAEGYDPKLRDLDIEIAESAFDPVLSSSFSYGRTDQAQTSLFSSSSSASGSFDVKLQKKHSLGGTLGLVYDLSYSRQSGNSAITVNPLWKQGLSLQVTQPLLRNLGMDTNLTQIRIAQNNRDSSYFAFYQQLLNVTSDVRKSYWDLVNARENYELQRKSLELAENLYKITQERIKVGSLAAAEILDAERNVASKQDSLVVAEQNIYAAEDKLKQLMRPLDLQYYNTVRLVPTELAIFRKLEIVFAEVLRFALEHRPDLQQSKLSLQNICYQVDFQKNQLLPRFDLSASFGLAGVGEAPVDAWRQVREVDFPNWQIGVTLEIPLGNRAAASQYEKNLLQREQLMTQHHALESRVVLEIRQTVRGLTTAMTRVETARRTRELAEKQLLNEENKFRAGLIALFQVQDTEQKLTEARINEVTTLLDYQRALVALDKAKGALLESLSVYGIEVQSLQEVRSK